jgi:hypothetical protein
VLDELYEELHEDGEIDPLDFNLPSEGDVLMEDAQVHNPRGDEWMKTVLIAAKNNKYSGEDVGDFSECSQLVVIYKYLVNEAIKLSHVPVKQHGYVARRVLKGKIENHVLLIAAKTPDKVLTKGNIFEIVDAGIQRTTPGLITRGVKFLRASAVQIGLDIEKKTGRAPEMSQVLQEIKTLTRARDNLSKFDQLSRL